MTRKLIRNGNSETSLTIDKTMREHLGVTTEVDVQFVEGKIILTKPLTIKEAASNTVKRYGKTLKRLAK
jgi:hypothetical protein